MRFLAVPLVLVLSIVLWWKLVLAEGEYSYRMTVTVDDNGQLRTGSSVVKIWQKETIRGFGNVSTEIKGEAVSVDINDNETLFAVLDTNPQYVVHRAFPYPKTGIGGGVLK